MILTMIRCLSISVVENILLEGDLADIIVIKELTLNTLHRKKFCRRIRCNEFCLTYWRQGKYELRLC